MKASTTFSEDFDKFGNPVKKSPIQKLYECNTMEAYEQSL